MVCAALAAFSVFDTSVAHSLARRRSHRAHKTLSCHRHYTYKKKRSRGCPESTALEFLRNVVLAWPCGIVWKWFGVPTGGSLRLVPADRALIRVSNLSKYGNISFRGSGVRGRRTFCSRANLSLLAFFCALPFAAVRPSLASHWVCRRGSNGSKSRGRGQKFPDKIMWPGAWLESRKKVGPVGKFFFCSPSAVCGAGSGTDC